MRSEGISRAAVLPAPGLPPEIRSYPIPEIEPGAVLLRTIASEVCGTDVHLWHGRLAGVPYPLIPGHVSVGTVEEVGGTVVDKDVETDVDGCGRGSEVLESTAAAELAPGITTRASVAKPLAARMRRMRNFSA